MIEGIPEPQRVAAIRRPRRRRLGIGEIMVIVAGVAVGLWIIGLGAKGAGPLGETDGIESGIVILVGVLGGVSLVGVPLLLAERRRDRRPWGPGRVLWFSTGMAGWLMWPPVVYRRVAGSQETGSLTFACYFYGTPLMAIYVTLALLTGGWLGRRRRRRLRRSWREVFGLLLGLAWACTGLYLLYVLYAEDLKR